MSGPEPRDPVEEYFERLDAAFATLQTRAQPAPVPDAPAAAPAPASAPQVPPAAAPSLVAEAFMALLALEEGDPAAKPVRLVTGQHELRLTDAVIDELRRLIREELQRIRNTHV